MSVKLCSKCKKEKPASDFRFKNKYKTALHSWCKSCERGDKKRHYEVHKERIKAKKKLWDSLNKEKIRDYAKKRRLLNPEKLNKENNAWRAANRARTHEYNRKALYGITTEQYSKLMEEQNSSCAICGAMTNYGGKNLCIDHDHKTHKIRGLLCGACNSGLGYFKDDINLLLNSIEYLKKHINDIK